MTVRELKLAIASGVETEEIKTLNKFFDDLFNDVITYTDVDETNLIFMKGDTCIMSHDLQYGHLWVCNIEFYIYFEQIVNYNEAKEIIKYKVTEHFNNVLIIPIGIVLSSSNILKGGLIGTIYK